MKKPSLPSKNRLQPNEAVMSSSTNKVSISFSEILKIIPGCIFWKDINGVYLGCNDYFFEIAGTKDVIGKTDYDFPWKDQAEQVRANDRMVIHSNSTLEIEETGVIAAGKKVIMLSRKMPLKNEAGVVIGMLGIAIDITKSKAFEKALREAKEEEKEKAMAASKVKTEFLENMRHDIRTPLVGITSTASLISAVSKDPQIKEYVDNLNASSSALLDLFNEILDVIKLNSGEIPIYKKKFDLRKRLAQVIQLNQAKALHKNINLSFEHDENIPQYLIGDSTRMHRIVLELITNGLNFTEHGFVRLTTQLAEIEKRKVVIKIMVEDSGIGIEPEKQRDIFLQFKRLTSSLYKGVGLGLAVVKQFIDEMEGEIYVESSAGKGTKFTCIFPMRKSLLNESEGCEEVM